MQYQKDRAAQKIAELQGNVVDEFGNPVDLTKLTPEQLDRLVAAAPPSAAVARRDLLNKHPETSTVNYIDQVRNSVALLTTRFPSTSCSCCFTAVDVTNFGNYRACVACRYSIDICGVCVLHRSGIFRPELVQVPQPAPDDVKAAVGWDTQPVRHIETTAERHARLRAEGLPIPVEPDDPT